MGMRVDTLTLPCHSMRSRAGCLSLIARKTGAKKDYRSVPVGLASSFNLYHFILFLIRSGFGCFSFIAKHVT